MAANEYLQAAAGQLQSAASALKSEIDQLRGEFMTYERQVSHDMTTKEAEMRSHTARAATTADSSTAQHLMMEATRLKNEIDGHKKELEQRKRQLTQAIKAKEGAMNDIMSQSRSLQSKAGSLK
jgi:predicted  nucleic acid-binding Zn-ribbon protein